MFFLLFVVISYLFLLLEYVGDRTEGETCSRLVLINKKWIAIFDWKSRVIYQLISKIIFNEIF